MVCEEVGTWKQLRGLQLQRASRTGPGEKQNPRAFSESLERSGCPEKKGEGEDDICGAH